MPSIPRGNISSFRGGPPPEYSGGSNVDLLSSDEVRQKLDHRDSQLDEALAMLDEANREWVQAFETYSDRHGQAILRETGKEGSLITEAKARAEASVSKERIEMERWDAVRSYAKKLLDTRLAQLSGAQTDAKLILAQFQYDTSTTGRPVRESR